MGDAGQFGGTRRDGRVEPPMRETLTPVWPGVRLEFVATSPPARTPSPPAPAGASENSPRREPCGPSERRALRFPQVPAPEGAKESRQWDPGPEVLSHL